MNKVGRPRKTSFRKIENKFIKAFIEEVEVFMDENNKTQNDMANELNMHTPFFNKIMNGSNVTVNTIDKIMNHINVKVKFEKESI